MRWSGFDDNDDGDSDDDKDGDDSAISNHKLKIMSHAICLYF